MADENVTIGVRTEGADTAAQGVRDVGKSFEDLGSAGIKLQAMFKEIESAKTFEDKFDVAKRYTEELQTMTGYFSKMANGTNAATESAKKFSEATEEARKVLQEYGGELVKVGGSGVNLKGITTGFAEVDNTIRAADMAIDRFNEKEQSGARLWQRDVDLIAQQYRRLQVAMKDAFGDVDKAPPIVQAAAQRIRAEYETTITKMEQVRDAQQEVNRRLQEGGYQFQGLATAVRDAAGKYGPLIAQGIALGAAFKYGYSEGEKLREAIGTNTEVLDDFKEHMKTTGAQVQNTMDIMIADAINFRERLKEWDFKGALKELENFGTMGYQPLKKIQDQTKLTENEFKGFEDVVKAGVSVQDALGVSAAKLTEIHKLYTLALAGGKQGQEIWNKAVADADGNVDKLYKSLKDEEDQLVKLADKIDQTTRKHKDYHDVLDKVIPKNKELADAMEKANEIAQSQEKVTNGVTKSIMDEINTIGQFMGMGPNYRLEVAAIGEALKTTAENQQGLTEARKKELIALADQLAKYPDMTAQERSDVEAKIKQIQAAQETNKAHGELHRTIVNGKEVWTNLTEAEQTATEKTISVKNAIGETVTHLGNMNKTVGDSPAKFHEAGTGLDEFATKLKSSGDNCDELSGKVAQLISTINQATAAANAMGSALHNASNAGTGDYNANQVINGQEVPNSSPTSSTTQTNPYLNTSEGP